MLKNIVKASELMGVKVNNLQNENLGKVEEIMFDKMSGEVSYLILSNGGFLTMSNDFFAIPWNAFQYDGQKDCLLLNIDKNRFKEAPSFTKDNWPDMADMSWGESIYSFYGTTPYWNRRKAA